MSSHELSRIMNVTTAAEKPQSRYLDENGKLNKNPSAGP